MARVIKTDVSYHQLDDAFDFSDVVIVGGEQRKTAFLFGLSVLAVAAIVTIFSGWLPLAIFLALAAIAFFAYRLDIGLYVLAFFAPFTGLIVNFGSYEWSRRIPYLSSVDAPFVDFFALVLLAALVLRILVLLPRREVSLMRSTPLLWFFVALVLTHVLSLFGANQELFLIGVKFILRPIIFMYVMFVVLPNSIIKNSKMVLRALRSFFAAGVLSALMGAVSFIFVGPFGGLWHRATPFAIGNFAPLGYNHNLLAEVLVLMVPIGVYFVYHERASWKKKWYFLATAVIALVALLTFARTAWIVLAVELMGFMYLYRVQIKRSVVGKHAGKIAGVILLMLLPAVIYMTAISSSRLVAGSTSTRLDLTEISWEYFKRSPWIGNGPGSFIPIVADTRIFAIEYGDPLDAHGMIQKVIAENGMIGLLAWVVLLLAIMATLIRSYRTITKQDDRRLLGALIVMVLGAMVYQLLNTSYYNAKMWLPIGLAIATAQVLVCQKTTSKSK